MSWKPSTPSVTADEIEHIVSQWPVAIVHVWAEWNQADRVMDMQLQSLMADFPDVGFVSLEFDQDINMSFVIKHSAYAIPVLLCFLWGKYHSQFEFCGRIQLQDRISELIRVAES